MLEIAGGLDIANGDGLAVRVDADGRDLDITIDGKRSSMLRTLAGARRALPWFRLATETLAGAGVRATVRAGGRIIGMIGRDVESDRLARVLHIRHAKLGR